MGGDSGLGPERIGEQASVGGGDPREGAGEYRDAAYGDAPYGEPPYGDAPYGDAPYGDAPYGDAPYGGSAEGPPGDRGGSHADGDDVWDDGPAHGDAADELPRLMARLGRLIARHGPGGVVAMARTDAERRELMAYAAGWQDAAAEFAPRVAAARRDGWLGRWRPLRVLNGPGDVIPFPVARQYARPPQTAQDRQPYDDELEPYPAEPYAPEPYPPGGHEPEGAGGHGRDEDQDARLPGRARESAPDTPARGAGARPGSGPEGTGPGGVYGGGDDPAHGGRDDDAEPSAGGPRAATRSHDDDGRAGGGRSGQGSGTGTGSGGQKPSLPAKSRWSRSPTIPRLVPPQRPPGRGPAGGGTPPPDPPA